MPKQEPRSPRLVGKENKMPAVFATRKTLSTCDMFVRLYVFLMVSYGNNDTFPCRFSNVRLSYAAK